MAAVLVAVLAGPTVMAAMKVIEAFSGSHAPFWSSMDMVGFALSLPIGLIGGGPAALIGAIAAHKLARRGLDAAWLAICAGILMGAAVAAPLMVFGYEPDRAYYLAVFEIAAVLMSLLHWLIAIRPLRRQRLEMNAALKSAASRP